MLAILRTAKFALTAQCHYPTANSAQISVLARSAMEIIRQLMGSALSCAMTSVHQFAILLRLITNVTSAKTIILTTMACVFHVIFYFQVAPNAQKTHAFKAVRERAAHAMEILIKIVLFAPMIITV